MKRIAKDQITREIWENRNEQIISFMRGKGWDSCPYTYENFKTDMMRRELLVDERTMRTKWELLLNTGVLTSTGRGRADLQFSAFLPYMSASCKSLLHRLQAGGESERESVKHRLLTTEEGA